MKTFHKNYSLAELKIIIRSWNKHFRIMVTGKKKKELADELSKHLEHDEDDEIQLKQHSVDFKPVLKKHRDDEATKKVAKKAKAEDTKTEKERDRLKAIVAERNRVEEATKKIVDEAKELQKYRDKLEREFQERSAKTRKEEEEKLKELREKFEKELQERNEIKRKEDEALRQKMEKEIEAKRVESFRNTGATSKLPYDVSSLIFSFLPQNVRTNVVEGTPKEQRDRANRDMFKFFESKKYGKTKKEGEKFFDDLLDQSEAFQENRGGRESSIADELYADYMNSRKRGPTLAQEEAAQERAQDKAVELAKKYYIEEFIDMKKQGKTNREIVEEFLERTY
jgi:hypothetical protein